MEKMKEIWIVWGAGGDDEFYSSERKAVRRCVELIIREKRKNIRELIEHLEELVDDSCAGGICGYYSREIDCFDDDDDEDVFWDGEELVEDNIPSWLGEEEDESEWEDNVNDDDEECDRVDLSHLYRDSSNGRDMYYHIYNRYSMGHPLTMNGRALEFDNIEAAFRFLKSVRENTDFDLEDAIVLKDILYYDGLYIDATNCVVGKSGGLVELKGE